jgi:predicted DCC family thiol-disulfide oxidoreductase YuxK
VLRVTGDPASGKSASQSSADPIVLYDGVCGLCNRLVQFILRRDQAGVFRFASLQSPLASRILARHGADARDLDTVYVVVNGDTPEELLLARSDAVLFVLAQLGGIWGAGSFLFKLVPRALRDFAYSVIARRRYRVFGRSETCILPAPENRDRFLDL